MRTGTILGQLAPLLETPGLASLGPEPRAGAEPVPVLDSKLQQAFHDIRLTPALKDLIRALIYLWHDHLDPSHEISQGIETQDGSLVHGLMHRREPDYGNAKYWYRRVGAHPSFLALAVRAGDLLDRAGDSDLRSRLLPNRTWDPFAFIDAVEDARHGQFSSQIPLLEQLQKLEFECLLENLTNRI